MKLPSCPRTLIINVLRKHPDGLTLTSIAQLTGLHRHTATKYVYELKGAGIINERDVGSAKLCYLREGFSKTEEKKLVQRLNGKKKSSVGQVQIITAFVFLFLVPATIIIAQNATNPIEGNLALEKTKISDFGNLETEGITETFQQENCPEQVIDLENTTLSEPVKLSIDQNVGNQNVFDETSVSVGDEENLTEQDETLSEGLFSETILPEGGIFENQTQKTYANEAIQESENQSGGETETITILETQKPILEVEILSPERITRGKSFDISGIVKNLGTADARNVRIFWEIPNGFEVISGEAEKECGILPPDSECSTNLTISSSLSTDIGRKEFKLLVKYEK